MASVHAIRNELDAESAQLADQSLEEWARGLPEEDTKALLNNSAGKPIRSIAGKGWMAGRK